MRRELALLFVIIVVAAVVLGYTVRISTTDKDHNNMIDLSQQKQNYINCMQHLKSIAVAMDVFRRTHYYYPQSLDYLFPVSNTDRERIIRCPSSMRIYSSNFNSDRTAYTVFCSGAVHRDVGIPPNFPQYDSISGPHFPLTYLK